MNAETLFSPERVSFGLDKKDVVVSICLNTGSSTGTHSIDIRTLEGASIQQLHIDSNIHESMFGVRLMDIDGDGAIDLLVASGMMGGGPYMAVDVYRFKSKSGQLELDEGISGISWPTIAATPGCVVAEMKNGSEGHYATRHCFARDTGEWTQTESCKLGDSDSSVCPGQLLK